MAKTVLIVGATGFTGKLVAIYLATHPELSNFDLVLGGRSQSKLDAVVAELPSGTARTVKVDVNNDEEVENAVKPVNVVINTAGPYWHYGTPVVRACAKFGVHYVDLTGENHWVHTIIQEFDALAIQTHAAIIPSCGFDSLPSDLVVHRAAQTLRSHLGPFTMLRQSVTAVDWNDSMSGGTLATVISVAESVPKSLLSATSKDWSNSPVSGARQPPFRLIYTLPGPAEGKPVHGGFFVMGPANRQVVQRTAGLAAYAAQNSTDPAKSIFYGPEFTYEEFDQRPSRIYGLGLSLAMAVFNVVLAFPPTRWLIRRYGPKPGEGPSEEYQKNGRFQLTNMTSSEDGKVWAKTIYKGTGDPGYLHTSVLIAESALALAFDHDRLPARGREGGILTPASALGDVVIERILRAGRTTLESYIVDAEGKKTN